MKYIPPDLLEKVKKIDLLTFLKNYYPQEVVRDTRTQYSTKTHDSLKMSNGLWNWYSRGIGGKNAIDFLEKTQNMKFPDSALFVLEKMQCQMPIFEEKQEENKIKQIILPERNINENIVKNYLKSRGIDKEIVNYCIERKLVYEEKHYHNVVFCGYDEFGNIKYAGCRATNGSNIKNDATGSDKAYSFKIESNKKTDKIYIFEGAIDVLSFATFFKIYGKPWRDKTLISLAGVYQPAKIIEKSKVPKTIQNYLKKHPEIKQIYLCLDNDLAGRNATNALKKVISDKYEVVDRPPKNGKDYNEYLCNYIAEKTIKRKRNLEIK